MRLEEKEEHRIEERQEQKSSYLTKIEKITNSILIFIIGMAVGYCWCWNALKGGG